MTTHQKAVWSEQLISNLRRAEYNLEDVVAGEAGYHKKAYL